MAEDTGTPIAEAAVQITMDRDQVNEEVQALQKDLQGATGQAEASLGGTGEAAADTSDNLNKVAASAQVSGLSASQLTKSMMMLSRSMSSGSMSGRSMLFMLRMLGPQAVATGAVIGAAFAGIKLGNILVDMQGTTEAAKRAGRSAGKWFMDTFASTAAERRDAAFSKIFETGIKDKMLSDLAKKVSDIGSPKSMEQADFMGKMFAVDEAKLKMQQGLALAQYEAAGRDTYQLKKSQAAEQEELTRTHLTNENTMIQTALQETANTYLKTQKNLDTQIAKAKARMSGGYTDVDSTEQAKRYEADFKLIQTLSEQKRELEKNGLVEMGNLNAQVAMNNIRMAEAEAQAKIAALKKVQDIELRSGADSIWAAALKGKEAELNMQGGIGPGKFGDRAAADIAKTLELERGIAGDTTSATPINAHAENPSNVQIVEAKKQNTTLNAILEAIRARPGSSVWIGGM